MGKSLKRGLSVFLVLLMVFSSIPLTDSFADMVSNFAITASAMEATDETENNYDLVESSGRSRTMFAATASIDTPITPDDESNASKYGICEYFTGWYDGGNPTAGAIRRNYALRIVKIYPDGTFYGIGYVLPRSGSSTANGSYYLKGTIDFSNMTLSWQGYEWIKKISDDFEFLDFYNGSISETNNVLTGNTVWGDVTLTSDENALGTIYNKLQVLNASVNEITVYVTATSKNTGVAEPVSFAFVEVYFAGKVIKRTKTNSNGIVQITNEELLKATNWKYSAANLLDSAMIYAYKNVGNEVYLLSARGAFEYNRISSYVNLTLDYAQFRPELSVAFDNTNHSIDEVKSIMNMFVKDFYSLTNAMVQIKISEYIECNNKGNAGNSDVIAKGDKFRKSGADIWIYDTIDNCCATPGGYKSSGQIRMGFTYQSTVSLNTGVMCHEALHYIFGVYDEYTTGYEAINRQNGSSEPYALDINGNGRIDSDYYNLAWVQNRAEVHSSATILNSNDIIKKSIRGINDTFELMKHFDVSLINSDGTINGYIISYPNTEATSNFYFGEEETSHIFLTSIGEEYGTYWSAGIFHKPSSFGIMDNSSSMFISDSESYSYLNTSEYAVKNKSEHPEYYTSHYYKYECSVAEKIKLRINGVIPQYEVYDLGAPYSYVNSAPIVENETTYTIINDTSLIENDNLKLLKNSTMSSEVFADAKFFTEEENLVLKIDNTDGYRITVLAKYKETDSLEKLVTSSETSIVTYCSELLDELSYIYIVGEKEENLITNIYSFESFGEELSNATHITDNNSVSISANDNYIKHTVISEKCEYSFGDYISIAVPFTFITETKDDNLCLMQSIPYQKGIDFTDAKIIFINNEGTEEVKVYPSRGEGACAYFNFEFLGNGKYILVAKQKDSTSFATPSDIKVSLSNTNFDNEVLISFKDTNYQNDIAFYNLYYSMSEIKDTSKSDVYCKVLIPGQEEYAVCLDKGYGIYYFVIEAIGKNGGYSDLSVSAQFEITPKDSNGDGLPDFWIQNFGLPLTTDLSNVDTDADGLTNLQEYNLGTNPINPDTDGDNVYDGIEVDNNLNPLKEKSNDVDFDYILLYGQPNLSVTSESIGISDEDFIFKVKNEAEGAALRTNIKIVSNGNILFAWEVNIRAYDEIEITAPISTLSSYDNFEIVIDENQITYDSNYADNNLIIGVSDEFSIDYEEKAVVKNSTEKIVPIVTHNYCECFRFTSSNNKAVVVDDYGNLTAKGIGISTITITNMRGYAKSFDVYVVAFQGAEYSEFDSKLINNNTEVVIIGYIGDDSSIVIPETIGSLPVTQLSSYAFEDCTFKEATIHSGINSIANTTFSDTTSLEKIIVDEANTSYCSVGGILYSSDKTQLIKYPSAKTDTIFAIPETVTSIGAYSIKDCDCIEEITIPESVTSIGSSAIGNCNNLKKVNYNAVSSSAPSGFLGMYTTFYGSNAIEKVIIGDNVTVIPQYLFFGKNSLTEIVITENSKLSTIAQYAFYNCSKLANVFIPETVKTIGTCAFYGCSKLNGVTLPEALTSIGSSAFSGCSSLTSIKIPETVTSISDNTFANCTALEKIEIPYQITTIGETPLKGCSKVVVWCYNNSVAYEYVVANSIKYKIMELNADDLVVTGIQETFIDSLQYQLSAEIAPIYTDEKIVWSSSDSKVFTVSNTGLLTAKGAGEAILTVASSRGSVSKTFTINVLGLSKDSENTNLYHARNADDMLALSTMVNSGVSFAGKIIQLDNDIDLSNVAWTPIGTNSTYAFSGVFDGNNRTISGLNYETTSNTYAGLFGYIKTGGIKNLTVEGSVSGKENVGIFAGCILDSALYNCKAIGEVKRIASGSYGYVGGLVGSALHSVIINCAAETDITVDFGTSSIYYAAVGGIAGVASTSGSEPMCILNSYCIGDISVNGNIYYSSYENYYIGGIAGYLKDDAANNYYFGEITNADEDPIKKIGYTFGYVVPEYTSESDYNGIGTIIVQDNYYLEGKSAIGKIATGDYDTTDWTTSVTEESFSKLIGEGSLVDELNGNKGCVEEIIVAHRDILSNSTWAELVDRINGDSFTVSSWKIGANNLPVNYECDCYRHAESDWIVDVEATCTNEGSKHTYCLVCQEIITTSVIEKTQHKFSEWTETKAVTCTEKGSESRTCTSCSTATETRDIDKLGHKFEGDWTIDKAPTCTKAGSESRVCIRCESEKETHTVEKLGHDFESEWTVDKEATCSKAGSKSHHCSRCDEKSDVTVINKLAHSYKESVQEATCTKDGKKTYNCSSCGDSYSEVIAAKGHVDQNGDGKCDNCDYIYDNTCDHMCHKSGFNGFIWKIVRFFWKLFKMNPVCECGVAHY